MMQSKTLELNLSATLNLIAYLCDGMFPIIMISAFLLKPNEINTSANNMHYSKPVLQEYYQQGTAKDRSSQRCKQLQALQARNNCCISLKYECAQRTTTSILCANLYNQHNFIIHWHFILFIAGKQFPLLHK